MNTPTKRTTQDTETERKVMVDPDEALQEAWCKVLAIGQPHDDQNFFDLGGDSLLTIELFTSVQEASGWELPIEVLFSEGTLRSLRQAATSR